MNDDNLKAQAFRLAHPDGDYYDDDASFDEKCVLCTQELRKLQNEEVRINNNRA